MIKKTITYEDYDGVQRKEDYYFGLNKAELFNWQNSVTGGMDALLSKIVQEQDQTKLVEYFQEIISRSYGVKDDSKHFRKSKELLDEFMSTPAYDVLYMELVSDTDAAVNFIKGIVPPDLGAQVSSSAIDSTVNDTLMPA